MTLIKELARANIEQQAAKIKGLVAGVMGELGLTAADDVVRELLVKRRAAIWLADELNCARKEEDEAKTNTRF